MKSEKLEIRALSPEYIDGLLEMLNALTADGNADQFHPHPFDRPTIAALATESGADQYYVLRYGNHIWGYGMLRGWDAGYAIPSLGIAIHPQLRGRGLGTLLMHHLHTAAQLCGASQIRLKVYPDNEPAVSLYRRLGYQFTGEEAGQLVGYCTL
jgi:ribosomal-protein-alanine N-acetyltransferase